MKNNMTWVRGVVGIPDFVVYDYELERILDLFKGKGWVRTRVVCDECGRSEQWTINRLKYLVHLGKIERRIVYGMTFEWRLK